MATKRPSITVVVAAYQAEQWIGETLESILGQTHPADEVIVVDDGSTDGTARELERFAEKIRVIRRTNGGCSAAFNTGFQAAQGDYVAECGSDDIWEPEKLERQVTALEAHPEVDIIFCAARLFGNQEGQWAMPPEDSSVGVLDRRQFGLTLFRVNPVCPSTTLTRRSLYEQLAPFAERDELGTEDYDFWMRSQRAGAIFYYDPRMLVRHRRHESNASSNHLVMKRADLHVHTRDMDLIDDRSLVQKVLARDYFVIGWLLQDQGSSREARSAFVASLRHKPSLRALAWVLVLSAPERHRRTIGDRVVSFKRTLRAEPSR
jgi:glycosyltransferase involved in cell wall biosynthesis